MPQTKAYKEYYTAAETKAKLGITDGQLYNYVRYGHLERITPPGRKQGVYRREDVDKLALEIRAFLSGSTNVKRITFTKVTKEDIPENVKLAQAIFGPKTGITIATRTAWIEKNPDVSYQLCLDSTIIGCATLLPTTRERIESILKGQANSEETTSNDVETYSKGGKYNIYIMGVGIEPSFSKTEKRIYGGKLVRGISEALIDLGKRGIEIEAITARSHTVDGIRLLRHLGFTQIPSVTQDVNFRIEISKSDIPLIDTYREELRKAIK